MVRTPAENEQFVREHWVRVWINPRTKEPRIGDIFFLTWAAAAEFTEQRQEEIRQVEEEVAQIDDLIGYKLSDIMREIDEIPPPHIESDPAILLIYVRDLCEYSRILAREQAALESLTKGMRP